MRGHPIYRIGVVRGFYCIAVHVREASLQLVVRRKGLDINLGGRGERLVFPCMQGVRG